jgi:uncharacterized protein YndB with AHSA1/START domain
MDARRESEPTAMKNPTDVERTSEREMVITRTFNGAARLVFEAWTKPELFKRWWVPKSAGLKKGGKTLLVMDEFHASKEALDAALGSYDGMGETFEQLDELLVRGLGT